MSEDNKDEMKDITTDHWAYNAVKKASLYIPMKNNNFEPEANITRKDFIIAIMNIIIGHLIDSSITQLIHYCVLLHN